MQNQTPIPLVINGIHIAAELDTSAATGLLSLLQNAPLLAIANHSRATLPLEYTLRLQSDIQTTAEVLGETLTALSLEAINGSDFITPDLLATYAATIGELLPFLTDLSDNLRDHAH